MLGKLLRLTRTRTHKRKRAGERGTALIATLLVASLLMMFCFAFLTETNTAASFSSRQQAKTRALYVAEAGAQRAYARLCSDLNWREGFHKEEIGSGYYNVTIDDCLTDAGLPRFAFRVTSTGTVRDVHRTVRLTLRPPSEKAFHYVCFSRDSTELRSGNFLGAEVWGPVYSSGAFQMDRRCNVYGDLLAVGDVCIGTPEARGAPARFRGDIFARGTVSIAPACSVLARDTTAQNCSIILPAKGDVTARQSIDCYGFIQGTKRSLNHRDMDSLPFPEDFFDMEWTSNEARKLRGYPLHTFSSAEKFMDFLEESYSADTQTYLLNGVFLVNDDIEIGVQNPRDKIIILGTLVAFGDVRLSSPAPFMLQRADSTFPAIVALGKKCKGGSIVFEPSGGLVAVSGLLYAKGEIYLGDRYPENEIIITGAQCAHRIYNGSHSRIVFDPSVRLVMPFSSHSLLIDTWEEL